MSSTLRGSKRLQVIQRWLQGIDDPNWEVFPTKKEGKYIVRARKTPLMPESQSPEVDAEDAADIEEADQSIDIESHDDTIKAEEPSTPKPKPKPKSSTIRKQPQYSTPFDPTINLEILNTLKSLGDEIKREREEKAQKRLMKQVVHKEMYGNYNRRTPFNDPYNGAYEQENPKQKNNEKVEYDDEYEDEPAPIPQSKPTYSRRRNNIFADIY